MAVVKLFKEVDIDYRSDGDGVVDAIRADVYDEDNGEFYLELEIKNKDLKLLEQRNIVAVKHKGSWQGFRLGYKETLANTTYYKAYHVSYDMQDYLIRDLLLDGVAFNSAIGQIKGATTRTNPFVFNTLKTTNVEMEIHNKSLYDVVFAMLSSYNCHILRDNYNITIQNKIGEENENVVEYGNNLLVLNEYSNINDLVTELYPTMVFNNQEYSLVAEKVSDINLYDKVYTKHVEFYPFNNDYLMTFVDEISNLESENERLLNTNDSSNASIEGLSENITSTQAEIDLKLAEVEEIETQYMSKLNTSLALRQKIYNECVSKINAGLSAVNKKITSTNANITAKNKKLTSKQNSYDSNQELYSKYTKKGYKQKAKTVKTKVTKLRGEISALKTEIRKLESTLSTYNRQKTKLLDYKDKFKNVDDVTSFNISALMKLLKEYGLKTINDVAKEYAEADGTIDDKESVINDINSKYENIYRLQSELEELKNELAGYNESIATNNAIIAANESAISSKNTQLLLLIDEDLLNQANMHLKKYKYPQVCYEVSTLPFECNIGDSIIVRHGPLGIDLDTEVVATVYDTITQRYKTLQFGNTDYSIKSMYESVQNATNDAITRNQVLLENAHSNLLEKIAGLDGYYAGMTTEEVDSNGTLVEQDALLTIQQNRIGLKVSEESVQGLVKAEVEIAAGSITQEVVEQAKEEVARAVSGVYTLTVEAEDGTVFDDSTTTKVLKANLRQLNVDVTNTVDTNTFHWMRKSLDNSSDIKWNGTGHWGPTLTLTKSDFSDTCSFVCEAVISDTVYLLDNEGNQITDEDGYQITVPFVNTILRSEITITESFKGYKAKFLMLSDKILLQINADGKIMSINMETGERQTISIIADNVNLEGYTTVNKYFAIDADGKMKCTGGVLADWIIDGSKLISKDGSIIIDSATCKIQSTSADGITNEMSYGSFSASQAGVSRAHFSSNGFFAFDTSGTTESEFLRFSRTMARAKAAYNNTVTNSANVYVDSLGEFKRVASSSERYKINLKEIECPGLNTDRLLECSAYQYNYEPGYITDENCYKGIQLGFSADNLYAHYPIAVELDEEGRPEKPNERILIPAMFDLIKKLYARVETLEERLGE